jgi:CubicO group peptidase (beta-lactamase class C family)
MKLTSIWARVGDCQHNEAGTPMTDHTPVPIASTNKGMTALAIMQLVEQGLVELDAPVRVYREGDRLLGSAPGVSIEFVPQSDTTFIMLAIAAIDEAPVEFVKHADGSLILAFQGQPLGIKK